MLKLMTGSRMLGFADSVPRVRARPAQRIAVRRECDDYACGRRELSPHLSSGSMLIVESAAVRTDAPQLVLAGSGVFVWYDFGFAMHAALFMLMLL
jgi:hypothetical protein